MLTADEMARIEEEERKKHAEEQFRRAVRGRLQQQPEAKSGIPPKIVLLIVLGVLFRDCEHNLPPIHAIPRCAWPGLVG